MSKTIYFGGRNIIKPGVYSTINVDALVPFRLGPANTIGVIGVAEGGKPRTVTTINSPQEAKLQLKGGVMRNLIELMYDPSQEIQGAGEIKYYRLNNAVVSSLTVKDAGASNVLVFTSRDWGVRTTQLRVKIETGTLSGKKISINDVLTPLTVESGDNLGQAFSIQYVGALNSARMSIAKVGDVATTLLIESSVNGSDWITVSSLDLSNPNMATMGVLADFLDNLTDFDVQLAGDQNLSVSHLDAVSNQDIKTAPYYATAAIGAIVHWVNTNSILVSAARMPGASSVPANIAYTFLAGGTEGAAVINSDWSTALDAFLTENVDFIFVCSESSAVHAMALAHCNQASGVKERMERRAIMGGAANEAVETFVARCEALADARAQLCYPGIKRLNLTTGLVDSLSPMYSAAIVAGMRAGVTPATSLTFKQIRVTGLERAFTQTEVERLLDRGGLIFEYDRSNGTYRIVQDLTTYLKDGNVIYRKGIGMSIHDYLQKQTRAAVQPFIGKTADKRKTNLILAAVKNRLTQLTRSDTNLNGVLTTGTDAQGNPEPSFKNIRVSFDGFDLVEITYEAHPVGEVAYITIAATLTPTQIVATA